MYLDIKYICTDDWKAVYLDDKLAVEGHHVRLSDVLEMLRNRGLITYKSLWIDQEDVEEKLECHFPEEYSEIPSNIVKNY